MIELNNMIEINNTTRQKINFKRIEKLVGLFLNKFKRKDWSVSIAVISDKKMCALNFAYRGINQTTDVLSFPAAKSSDKFLGEVIININEIKRVRKYQAMIKEVGLFDGRKKKLQPQILFDFILVHGLLHLLGYNDETEKERAEMMKLGMKFLKK